MFKALFEGGQTPLYRRSPKRGFSHRSWDTAAHVINVGASPPPATPAEVTLDSLKAHGVLKGQPKHLRVLGTGEVGKKLVVQAHHFSASAKEKIEKAGGQAGPHPGPEAAGAKQDEAAAAQGGIEILAAPGWMTL